MDTTLSLWVSLSANPRVKLSHSDAEILAGFEKRIRRRQGLSPAICPKYFAWDVRTFNKPDCDAALSFQCTFVIRKEGAARVFGSEQLRGEVGHAGGTGSAGSAVSLRAASVQPGELCGRYAVRFLKRS